MKAYIVAVGYTMDTMYFGWLDAPVDVDKDVQLPEYTFTDVILYDCSQNYTGGNYLSHQTYHASFENDLLHLLQLVGQASGRGSECPAS